MITAPKPLSRFTPSLMAHELLERLFVARERTLDAIMTRVDSTASSEERNHTLLVGPRGAGKTHLVSLVYHRVNQRRREGARLQITWLPEDPWTIASYRHLLAAIAERLEPATDGDIPGALDELEPFLTERAKGGGPIVVIVENLDQILTAIGTKGQQQLRHFLQADRSLLLVATSTRLDRALSDQASPFYGFFTTTRLKPFDVDEAAAMLTAIAHEGGDDRLVEYLASDEGRARLRTISHLAGGQPRMWAALASALTVEGLDDLVDLLLTRFDDLTPYYQEQLARLSGQQRLVVAELAELDRPINVKELAERLDIDQRSLAKTVSDLVERGWAAPTTSSVTKLLDKRRTYYELAEPLARLSFQIKESRGEPLRLVVEFLKHWFDPADLAAVTSVDVPSNYVLLAVEGQSRDPVVAVTRRLHRLPGTEAHAITLLGEIDDALSAIASQDPEPFLRLAVPVRAALEQRIATSGLSAVRLQIHRVAHAELGHTRRPEMDRWVSSARHLVTTCDEASAAFAHLVLSDWLGRAWRFDEALAVYDAAATTTARQDVLLMVRTHLATSSWEAGRTDETVEMIRALAVDYGQLVGPDHALTLRARHNLATAHWRIGNTAQAIEMATDVRDRARRFLGDEHPIAFAARATLGAALSRAGRAQEAVAVEEQLLADSSRILGNDHRSTLTARINLTLSYARAGRTAEAIQAGRAAVSENARVLGAENPATLAAGTNLAHALWQAGQSDDALALQKTVVADHERILGPEHPSTRDAKATLDRLNIGHAPNR